MVTSPVAAQSEVEPEPSLLLRLIPIRSHGIALILTESHLLYRVADT